MSGNSAATSESQGQMTAHKPNSSKDIMLPFSTVQTSQLITTAHHYNSNMFCLRFLFPQRYNRHHPRHNRKTKEQKQKPHKREQITKSSTTGTTFITNQSHPSLPGHQTNELAARALSSVDISIHSNAQPPRREEIPINSVAQPSLSRQGSIKQATKSSREDSPTNPLIQPPSTAETPIDTTPEVPCNPPSSISTLPIVPSTPPHRPYISRSASPRTLAPNLHDARADDRDIQTFTTGLAEAVNDADEGVKYVLEYVNDSPTGVTYPLRKIRRERVEEGDVGGEGVSGVELEEAVRDMFGGEGARSEEEQEQEQEQDEEGKEKVTGTYITLNIAKLTNISSHRPHPHLPPRSLRPTTFTTTSFLTNSSTAYIPATPTPHHSPPIRRLLSLEYPPTRPSQYLQCPIPRTIPRDRRHDRSAHSHPSPSINSETKPNAPIITHPPSPSPLPKTTTIAHPTSTSALTHHIAATRLPATSAFPTAHSLAYASAWRE
jgi:hypothetical protein